MAFYVNKKGADTALLDGVNDAQALKYKTLRESKIKEFVLYTKPVKVQDVEAFRELFSAACFAMLRCTKQKPKPTSQQVKSGECDHLLAVTVYPRTEKVSKWDVMISDDRVDIVQASDNAHDV